MSGRGKSQGFLQLLLQRYRSSISLSSSNSGSNGSLLGRRPDEVAAAKVGGNGCFPSKHHGLQIITSKTNIVKGGKDNKVQTQITAPPSGYNFPHWAKWILGSILTLLLPFWKQKWMQLLKIEGEAEMVIQEVETVAEVVEKVAIVTEKVSEELADKLPDNGKLKEAALLVERVSKATAQDAQLTIDMIHKVDDVKQDLGTLVEPLVDKILDHSKAKKKVTAN